MGEDFGDVSLCGERMVDGAAVGVAERAAKAAAGAGSTGMPETRMGDTLERGWIPAGEAATLTAARPAPGTARIAV